MTATDIPAAATSQDQARIVEEAVEALLIEHNPTEESRIEFRGHQYDAGLAWVHHLLVRGEVLRLTNARAAQNARSGNPGPEASVSKLMLAEFNKDLTAKVIDLEGPAGMVDYDYEFRRPTAISIDGKSGDTHHSFLRARANSIEGGTSEIMRNILGEQVLGLPGEPRVDKKIPWRDVPATDPPTIAKAFARRPPAATCRTTGADTMTMPTDVGIIDTMIGFPATDFEQYEFIRKQLKDAESAEFDFPVEYMFKGVPKEKYGAPDPIRLTLDEMDAYGIEFGLTGCEGEVNRKALAEHPDRFVATCQVDANDVVGAVRKIRHCHDEYDIRAVGTFPAGCFPQIPIDDAKWYPTYATCCELDIPVFVCAGVPGPRLPMDCQHVERLDRVMYDFPELTLVTRHGCEPWEALAVKLMLKWPGLHYSTSAFAPKHYPRAIIDYANTRGADKVIYAGYFPMGLSLQRIMTDMPGVGLRDEVWPKFLRNNAARVLKIT